MKNLLRKSIFSLFALCSLVLLQAQDTETRNLGSFDGISVSAGVQADLVKGSSNKIEITATGIDLDKVKSEIKGDVLKVGIDESWWKMLGKKSKRTVEVVITYTSALETLAASSGSSLEADHSIASKNLEMDVSSGAHINLQLDVDDATLDLSSGSFVELSGNAKSFDVDMSSGSTLKAYELVSDKVHVEGSSGSNANVHAQNALSVDISSGASVKYKGNPESRDFDKSSGASVRKA